MLKPVVRFLRLSARLLLEYNVHSKGLERVIERIARHVGVNVQKVMSESRSRRDQDPRRSSAAQGRETGNCRHHLALGKIRARLSQGAARSRTLTGPLFANMSLMRGILAQIARISERTSDISDQATCEESKTCPREV